MSPFDPADNGLRVLVGAQDGEPLVDAAARLVSDYNLARWELDCERQKLSDARAALRAAQRVLAHCIAYAPCDCGPNEDHDDECAHRGADAVLAAVTCEHCERPLATTYDDAAGPDSALCYSVRGGPPDALRDCVRVAAIGTER